MAWGDLADADDLIVAISSPPGNAPRGLVRVSGKGTMEAVSARLAGAPLVRRRQIAAVRVRARLGTTEIEVPALALVMPAPRSFTGEETVELLLVGASAVLSAVVDSLCDPSRGSPAPRRANPGEFSARAYLNGRLALDEAEAIAASIAAESDTQLEAATRLRGGAVVEIAKRVADEVVRLLALVEAGIDFTDQEDVVAITASDLVEAIARVDGELAAVEARAVPAESLRALPTVALRGAPNAGKSSLFNALVGHERTIESHHAGSTRDAIVEPMRLDPEREALLVDLPGIEDPRGALEAQIQDLAHASLRDATIQLLCVPAGEPCPVCGDGRTIVVRTKSDLARGSQAGATEIATSARTGEGIKRLKTAIAQHLAGSSARGELHAGVLAERHRHALGESRSALALARELAEASVRGGLRAPEPVEVVALELRRALDALGIVAGQRLPDDILEAIFSKFCVGK
ncbi:MAG: hypothetical protein EXS03_09455 [Phycisphaerales bacterium]|nr:hypothetical protein [Phycisphaerales bacterium]